MCMSMSDGQVLKSSSDDSTMKFEYSVPLSDASSMTDDHAGFEEEPEREITDEHSGYEPYDAAAS